MQMGHYGVNQQWSCHGVTNYLTMHLNKIAGDVLAFWETHKSMFPILSQLADLYLSMSASSVDVENMFSTIGLILNGKRSRHVDWNIIHSR